MNLPSARPPAGSERDQAAGLRDLFANRPTQVIAFAGGGGGSGRTTIAVQMAQSLARSGLRTILVDENDHATNALSMLDQENAGDLVEALMIGTPLARLVSKVEPNLWVTSAAKAAVMLRYDSPKTFEVAAALMAPLEEAAKFVLIDSLVLEGGSLSLLSAQSHHMVVVVTADSEAITRTYALIKRLVKERGHHGFHLAITRARSGKEADRIYHNVMTTALKHLGVRVSYLGNIGYPLPPSLGDMLLARLPMSNERASERFSAPKSRARSAL